jgi:hypothetical protein
MLGAVGTNPEHTLVPVLMQEVTTQAQAPDLQDLTRDKAPAVGIVEVADLLHLGTYGTFVRHMLNHGVLTEVRLQLRMGPIGESQLMTAGGQIWPERLLLCLHIRPLALRPKDPKGVSMRKPIERKNFRAISKLSKVLRISLTSRAVSLAIYAKRSSWVISDCFVMLGTKLPSFCSVLGL